MKVSRFVAIALAGVALAGAAAARKQEGAMGIWSLLARERVLVSILDKGIEPFAEPEKARILWRETLDALSAAAGEDGKLLGRVHTVLIRDGAATGRKTPRDALSRQRAAASAGTAVRDGRTFLELAFAAGPPDPAAIRAALERLPPRAASPIHDFDTRFLEYLARHGLAVEVVDTATRDATGRPAFHAVLAAYGERIARGAPKDLDRLLAAELDPRFNPQLVLQKSDPPEAGLEYPMEARAPNHVARPLRLVISWSLDGQAVRFPTLDRIDAGAAAAERPLAAWRGGKKPPYPPRSFPLAR